MITPQTEAPELAQALDIPKLYFKREDLHPYGSHKGRSIPLMIDIKAREGATKFAISSSGNAALAAIRHIQKLNQEGSNLQLTVLTGEHINPEKKLLLEKEIIDKNIELRESKRPLQALFELIKHEETVSLRQSNDPDALLGYTNLAAEISATPNLCAVFIPASTGTAAQAIAEYFAKSEKKVSVHIVQTTENSTLVKEYGEGDSIKEKSLADAIVDKIGYRSDALKVALEKTDGAGWIVSNKEITDAVALLKGKAQIDASPNGVLGFAGLMRALKHGKTFNGAVVCVITGK